MLATGEKNGSYKHGLYSHPSFTVWKNMIARCYNPKHTRYRRYGGRGIMVCDRWLSAENFIEDMGTKIDGMSIERKDLHLDYTPENCMWIPIGDQASNRSTNRWLTLEDGRTVTVAQASRELGLGERAIRGRLDRHGTIYGTRKYTRKA